MSIEQIGRIAFREEGHMWNAYYAQNDTMKDALFLGSIRLKTVRSNVERRDRFIQLMRETVSEAMEESLGVAPYWKEPVPAPEHERGGSV